LLIEPLADRHDRVGFDSGVEPLDRYFRTQAGHDGRHGVTPCFVLVEGSATPLGYYTLAAATLSLTHVSELLSERFPPYPSLPAILLERLVVDRRHRGRRLGEHMLMDAFARALCSETATYAVVVHAMDEAALAFYRAYNFLQLTDSPCRLAIPMVEIARLFV
jgi:predicted GNAT family N-acyltransferase